MEIVRLVDAMPPGEADDTLLAHEAAAGNGRAFVGLYDRYVQRSFTFCHRLLGDHEQAALAVEATFVRLAGQLSQIRRSAQHDVRMQLLAAAHTECHRPSTQGTPAPDPDADVPHYGATRSASAGVAAHSALSLDHRELLVLRDLEGLTCRQMAAIVGLDKGQVARSFMQARIAMFDLVHPAQAFPSRPDQCLRALGLTVLCEDPDSVGLPQCGWLAHHLAECAACARDVGRAREGAALYATLPQPEPPHWLRHQTIARAAEAVGVNWQAEAPAPPAPERPSLLAGGVMGSVPGLKAAFAAARRVPTPPVSLNLGAAAHARELASSRLASGRSAGVSAGVAACALGAFVAVALIGSNHGTTQTKAAPQAVLPAAPLAVQPPPPRGSEPTSQSFAPFENAASTASEVTRRLVTLPSHRSSSHPTRPTTTQNAATTGSTSAQASDTQSTATQTPSQTTTQSSTPTDRGTGTSTDTGSSTGTATSTGTTTDGSTSSDPGPTAGGQDPATGGQDPATGGQDPPTTGQDAPSTDSTASAVNPNSDPTSPNPGASQTQADPTSGDQTPAPSSGP